jgi:type IV secretory pathway VirB9-like protein
MNLIPLFLLLGLTAAPHTTPTSAVVVECDFSTANRDAITNIYCQVGYATVFELPVGRSIQSVVIGDPKGWKAESNGTFCFISPSDPGLLTSLSIIDDLNRLYLFNLIERSLNPQKSIVARVRIILATGSFFISAPVQGQATGTDTLPPIDTPPTVPIASPNRIRIKDNHFLIEKVLDDRVFTYIYLARSQYRPAIFYSDPKNRVELEPIKYVDKGDYYVLHKTLLSRHDSFILKLGAIKTVILLK